VNIISFQKEAAATHTWKKFRDSSGLYWNDYYCTICCLPLTEYLDDENCKMLAMPINITCNEKIMKDIIR